MQRSQSAADQARKRSNSSGTLLAGFSSSPAGSKSAPIVLVDPTRAPKRQKVATPNSALTATTRRPLQPSNVHNQQQLHSYKPALFKPHPASTPPVVPKQSQQTPRALSRTAPSTPSTPTTPRTPSTPNTAKSASMSGSFASYPVSARSASLPATVPSTEKKSSVRDGTSVSRAFHPRGACKQIGKFATQFVFQADDGWEMYCDHANSALLTAIASANGVPCFTLKLQGHLYQLNLTSLNQTRVSTGRVREISFTYNRAAGALGLDNRPLTVLTHHTNPPPAALARTVDYCSVSLQLPPNWLFTATKSAMPYRLPNLREVYMVPVHGKSAEFQEVRAQMLKTMPTAIIHSLTRVQNLPLLDYYLNHLTVLRRLHPHTTEEHFLFHGSGTNDPQSIAQGMQGVDPRLSKDTARWGRGAYFAIDAAYSHEYTHRLPNGQCRMLVCTVSLGEAVALPPDPTLVLPPLTGDGVTRYNTVIANCGCTYRDQKFASKNYVVYELHRSYPRYVVTYTA